MHGSIITLDGPVDPSIVGGKAAGIARLTAAGFTTPHGVVIPPHVTDAEIEDAAASIAGTFPGTRLAVRSSAVGEDGADRSYAGQFTTVLGVAPNPEIIGEAISRVRASAAGRLPMAVLVMPMLTPDASGIAFTRHPVTGSQVVVIEAVAGLADTLAAGGVDGERWEVDARAHGPSSPSVLDDETATRIADLARRVEEALGRPQDIEWVLSDDELTLVQARPITTIDDVEPVPMAEEIPPGPWDWDSTHSQVPQSPFHRSFFPAAFTRASILLAERYGLPIKRLEMRSIGGYIHIQVVPLVGKPGAPPPPAPIAKVAFKMHPAFRRRTAAARKALDERHDRSWAERWHTERRPAFEADMAAWRALDLEDLDNDALADHLQATLDASAECFAWNMTTDLSYLLPMSALLAFGRRHLGLEMAEVIRLLAGASPSEYVSSLRQLGRLLTPEDRAAIRDGARDDVGSPEFWSAYERHRATTGSRLLGYDVAELTLAETTIDELSSIAFDTTTDPAADARSYAKELSDRLPESLRAEFAEQVREARDTYPIREDSEYVNARIAGYVRYALMAAGQRMCTAGQLERPTHAVFLEVEEVLTWLRTGHPLPAGLVQRRRGEQRWAREHPPEGGAPDEAMMPDPAIFPEAIARMMDAIGLVVAHDMPSGLESGRGLGASPGRFTGPVRRVHSASDIDRVQAGDVLVAPLTNSAWETIFPLIGALVTEGGGLLSHPAIVAREYGLPAVTGFPGALDRFSDGQLVTVDGSAGTVTPVG